MTTTKLVAEYKKKGYKNVRAMKIYENRKRVDIITATAKKTTPTIERAMYSGTAKNPRVHIATYVPSTKKSFRFKPKYAKRR